MVTATRKGKKKQQDLEAQLAARGLTMDQNGALVELPGSNTEENPGQDDSNNGQSASGSGSESASESESESESGESESEEEGQATTKK